MKNVTFPVWIACWTFFSAVSAVSPDAGPAVGDTRVAVAISVSPDTVASGASTSVTVRLEPRPGIKLNKYPKIKLQVPAVPGLVGAAEQSMGNPAPPPADQLDANYFHGRVDPLTLTLRLDGNASKGRHDVHAKLSYFYCVAASGYCAPAKTDVTFPVTVR